MNWFSMIFLLLHIRMDQNMDTLNTKHTSSFIVQSYDVKYKTTPRDGKTILWLFSL